MYVTGQSTGTNFATDIATVKLSAAGQQQWVSRFNGPASGVDVAVKLVLDDSGFVYVCGVFNNPNGVTAKYGLLKFNPSNGDRVWTRGYQNSTVYTEKVNDIAIDARGNIALGGYYSASSTDVIHRFTEVYDRTGSRLWRNQTSTTSNNFECRGIQFDREGNVFVTGPGSGLSSITIKYNAQGVEQWIDSRTFARDSLYVDMSYRSIATDRNGNAYIIGHARSGSRLDATNWDYALVKYAPDRLPRIQSQPDTNARVGQLYQYQIAASDPDGDTLTYRLAVAPQWLRVDSLTGRVFGAPQSGNIGDTIVTIVADDRHYGQSTQTYRLRVSPSTAVSGSAAPEVFALLQNYPNPFNPTTTIRYHLASDCMTTLKVYNLIGQEVAVLVNSVLEPGEHSVEFGAKEFSSGIYIYKLTSGSGIAVRKMTLQK